MIFSSEIIAEFASTMGDPAREALRPMESMAFVWLPFVGEYRTFLRNSVADHAELFAVAATL
jgi:hypothetical protein